MTNEIAKTYLSKLNETESIDPEEHPELILIPDFDSMSKGFVFSEANKTWFNEINQLTAEVNKEVATEVRKY